MRISDWSSDVCSSDLLLRTCAIAATHTFEEARCFALDAIGFTATATDALQADIDTHVEQKGEIGPDPHRPALQFGNASAIDPAATAMIGKTGIGKALAHHPITCAPRRQHPLTHQLCARGEQDRKSNRLN